MSQQLFLPKHQHLPETLMVGYSFKFSAYHNAYACGHLPCFQIRFKVGSVASVNLKFYKMMQLFVCKDLKSELEICWKCCVSSSVLAK